MTIADSNAWLSLFITVTRSNMSPHLGGNDYWSLLLADWTGTMAPLVKVLDTYDYETGQFFSQPSARTALYAAGGADGHYLALFVAAFPLLAVPTIHGIPNSLETIAAWHVIPPLFVIMALAFLMAGTQSGAVISVTSISP